MVLTINDKRIAGLIKKADSLFRSEPSYIELPSDKLLLFVGDTHGDYRSTSKVIRDFLGNNRLVFLGDYVDRPQERFGSIKNLEILLDAKVKNPQDIFLLRGNHEFENVFSNYGFTEELRGADMLYLKLAFEELFSNLPYVTSTENGIIAMHGGLPDVDSIDQIKRLPKGVKNFMELDKISQIVWNDHVDCTKLGMNKRGIQDNVGRGLGYPYGFLYHQPFFDEIMGKLGKKILLRGHEPSSKGYAIDNKVLTIFTSNNYRSYGDIEGVYVVKVDPKKELKSALDLEIIQL